ncbi:MAG: hypothetical protein GY810_06165 [Aureispira sp.]|nr:hypothetical protein [Aureispira sp.]
MPNKIHSFFSFHFSHDFDRICTVTDTWLKQPNTSMTPFISTAQIIEMMKEGLPAILRWVNEEVAKSDAVVLLIGSQTEGRYFIEYEIQQAILQQKPIYGIHINQVPDKSGKTEAKSLSPLPSLCSHYDWQEDNGAEHILDWTKRAIQEPIYQVNTSLEYQITAQPPSLEAFQQAKAQFFKNLN